VGILIEQHTNTSAFAVWQILSSVEDLKSACQNLPYDLSIVDQYGSEERQKQWLSVRLLCNYLNGKSKIDYLPSGKPFVKNTALSISHSHDLVGISMNNVKDTGIDVQRLDGKVLRIEQKFLNPQELDLYGGSLHKTTLVWSVKEAMYKLYGDCSPYFKKDFEVKLMGLSEAKCNMRYKGQIVEKFVKLRVFETFVMAIVND